MEKRELKWKAQRAKLCCCQICSGFYYFFLEHEYTQGTSRQSPPSIFLSTEAGEGLGECGRQVGAGEGGSFLPAGCGQVAFPLASSREPHIFSISQGPGKQFGICFAIQMISLRRLWHLSNLSTSQQDHTFAPTLSNDIKSYMLLAERVREGEKSQRKTTVHSKPSNDSALEQWGVGFFATVL